MDHQIEAEFLQKKFVYIIQIVVSHISGDTPDIAAGAESPFAKAVKEDQLAFVIRKRFIKIVRYKSDHLEVETVKRLFSIQDDRHAGTGPAHYDRRLFRISALHWRDLIFKDNPL
jgi:hypothetical protein